MKTHSQSHCLLLLVSSFTLLILAQLRAQTFTTLHNFTRLTTNSFGVYPNADGVSPSAGLAVFGDSLYGTTTAGGASGIGTVFKVALDGSGFTVLHSFARNVEGGWTPTSALIVDANTLFGSAAGSVFKMNTDGTGFTNLHIFSFTDGMGPGRLILSSNALYGTTQDGGTSGNLLAVGTVFTINTDGSGFTSLYNFTNTGADGFTPNDGLVLDSNTLYGTTCLGGVSDGGTVFKINKDGTGFAMLHSFTPLTNFINADGAMPRTGLVLAGNRLYGTTSWGGRFGWGTLFALNTNGSGFIVLHNFDSNADGGGPIGLTLAGDTLYGVTEFVDPAGGDIHYGALFRINLDGTNFSILYRFATPSGGPSLYSSTNIGGAFPNGGLVLVSNTLYGTAQIGGSSGSGTVFSLFVPPQLVLTLAGTNIVLTWPIQPGFSLQASGDLVSPSWKLVSDVLPSIVNGQNVLTNIISAERQFFRLAPQNGISASSTDALGSCDVESYPGTVTVRAGAGEHRHHDP